jgi:hypothetical protein
MTALLAIALSALVVGAFDRFPWSRIPLKASPGIGGPETRAKNRTSGQLTDLEVTWLANHHDVVIISGATQDPMNTSVCGESKIADVAKRLKAANPSVRTFVYFPSSKDESKIQHYCGENIFSQHPEWRVKLPDGSDWVNADGSLQHDLTQSAVRKWWIAAATNATFFTHFDGIFADNAIASNNQLMTKDGTRMTHKAGAALLKGQQVMSLIEGGAAGNIIDRGRGSR